MNGLRLEYEFSRDGDDFGWLKADLTTPDFCGSTGMWVQWQDLTELPAKLSPYPIPQFEPLTFEWGLGTTEGYVPVIAVAIGPRQATGSLFCDVRLTDYYDANRYCRATFVTDYPALASFAEEVRRMMEREGPDANLVATRDR